MFGTSIKKLFFDQRTLLIRRRYKHQHSSNGPIQMDIVQKRKVLAQFKDKAEVTVYDRQSSRTHFRWGPWVAGGQMLMWINFADFYWRYSMDKDEETGELHISPAWKRACTAGIALVAGLAVGGGVLHYISRSVARMQIIDGGQMVRLETYKFSGRGTKTKVVPIAGMFSRDKLYTGEGPNGVTKAKSSQYSIYASRQSNYAYIMSRSGAFRDPRAFDVLFHRAIAPDRK
ncbi:hypothetical protein H4S07_002580 [Coemansia furcata]|uniref:Uncharacterized protein n=1 Tax=Coemansia furcata TaxID=417177 RepID=A0ACC1LKJ8_9FUNG|nr:hypothetical protein H4S07_002580 [Coemansia furcata]